MESIPRHFWRTSLAAAHPVQHSGGTPTAVIIIVVLAVIAAGLLRRRGRS